MYLFDHDWNLVGGLELLLFFHILGIITPTDFHIFRGFETTNQEMDDTHVEGFVLLCYCVSGSVKNHHATYSSALIPDNSSLRRKVHKPLIINTSLNYLAWDYYYNAINLHQKASWHLKLYEIAIEMLPPGPVVFVWALAFSGIVEVWRTKTICSLQASTIGNCWLMI